MKKFIALLLAMSLVLGTMGTVFADEADTDGAEDMGATGEPAVDGAGDAAGEPEAGVAGTALTDIGGTVYETAVTALYNKAVITGDLEGTYRPEASITRAEACVIVSKAMGATDAELAAAADSGFTDLAGYDWAKGVINYAAERGIVSGRSEGIFAPAEEVTFAEMAVMLIKAQGISSDEITGEWPANYINKATELGMLSGVSVSGELDANASASRGNVAIMTYAVIDAIEGAEPGTGGDADTADGGSADGADTDGADGSDAGETGSGDGETDEE